MAEVDIAAVLQIVGNLLVEVRAIRQDMATRSDLEKFKHEVRTDFTTLRQTLTEYHSAVLGHGILISELEDRLRRIERHLGLPPAAA